MNILSAWKLTFDPTGTPLVLLDYGQEITGELAFALSKALDEQPIGGNAPPFLRPRNSTAYHFRFSVVMTAATNLAAQEAMMDFQILLAALGRRPLRVQPQGSANFWQYGNAYVTATEPQMVVTSIGPRWAKPLTISATSLTKT